MQGIWDSGTRGWGEFEKAMSGTMDLPTEFVVYCPPVSNELHGDLPSEMGERSLNFDTNGSAAPLRNHNILFVDRIMRANMCVLSDCFIFLGLL